MNQSKRCRHSNIPKLLIKIVYYQMLKVSPIGDANIMCNLLIRNRKFLPIFLCIHCCRLLVKWRNYTLTNNLIERKIDVHRINFAWTVLPHAMHIWVIELHWINNFLDFEVHSIVRLFTQLISLTFMYKLIIFRTNC